LKLNRVVIFPNCKINLGLNIISKRDDGFHNLETVFYPLPITDALEIISADKNVQQTDIEFSYSGLTIDADAENNLCVKAYRLLKKDFPAMPSAKMHLHKTVPMGAGLGGGSADASFTLLMLNNKFGLNLSTDQLINYAMQLGSDCPFFIINKPCFATGRGEILENIVLDLSAYKILLVNPGIHINTAWAFKQITPAIPAKPVRQIIQQPVEQWKDELVNDFEMPVIKAHPELKVLKDQLYAAGAVYASMSGSGSTFYGIYKKEAILNISRLPASYTVKLIVL